MFKYALNLVLRRKLRTLLTSLGIMIAVILMSFILFGMTDLQNAIVTQFSSQFKPTDLYVSSQEIMSGLSFVSAPSKEDETSEPVVLSEDVRNQITQLDGVTNTVPMFIISGVEVYLEDDPVKYPTNYVESASSDANADMYQSYIGQDTVLDMGEMFVSNFVPEFFELSNDEIIGKTVYVKSVPTAGIFSINTKSMIDKEYVFEVIGIVETGSDVFWINNEDALDMLVDLGGFESSDEYLDTIGYSQLLVHTEEGETTQIEEYITNELNLSVLSTKTMIDFVSTLTGGLTIALFLFGGISAVVAAIGIINTMIMSIYEQTKEIGIIKAIGASNLQVLTIFLIQSGLIGLLGGILGISITYLVMKVTDPFLVDILAQQGFSSIGGQFFHFQPFNALYITMGSILIGVIAGIYPAMKAAKLDPVKALRYE